MSGLGESIVSFAWNEGHAEARTSQSPPRYLISNFAPARDPFARSRPRCLEIPGEF